MSVDLQNIDCNCNNCIFMVRDSETYKKWLNWHKYLDEKEFIRNKAKAISDAQNHIDNAIDEHDLRSANGNMRVALKMKWQFDKKGLIHYGNCEKFKKPVSFIPDLCQIETQKCFENRRL